MSEPALSIPGHLRENARRWFSADGYGERWLAELPATVRRLATAWHLELGPPYLGGSHALVLAVRRAGWDGALKVPLRDDENRYEGQALRVYAGDGAVRLYEYDESTGAMLLEQAQDSPLSDHPDGDDAGLLVLCGLCRRLRCTPPAGVPFPRVVELARAWSDMMSGTLSGNPAAIPAEARPMVAVAADLAADYADHPMGIEMLINRDAHPENVLAAEREPWLLIDPKPLVGEIAFEAGHPLLNRLGVPRPYHGSSATPLVAGEPGSPRAHLGTPRRVIELAALLGRGLGADPQRVRGWALIRAAENLVWGSRLGLDITGDLVQLAAVHAAGVGTGTAAVAEGGSPPSAEAGRVGGD